MAPPLCAKRILIGQQAIRIRFAKRGGATVMLAVICPLTCRFIGEESVAAGERVELTDGPTWIIDPIDGTVNFVHR